MNMRLVFEDRYSEMFLKQIEDSPSYAYRELDKHITFKLLEQLAEHGFIPRLSYRSDSVGTLPLSYSQKRGVSISINIPVPDVELASEKDYKTPSEYSKALQAYKEILADYKEKL